MRKSSSNSEGVTCFGRDYPSVAAAARERGKNPVTVRGRIKRGKSLEEALSEEDFRDKNQQGRTQKYTALRSLILKTLEAHDDWVTTRELMSMDQELDTEGLPKIRAMLASLVDDQRAQSRAGNCRQYRIMSDGLQWSYTWQQKLLLQNKWEKRS
jgi:hypothetical protein